MTLYIYNYMDPEAEATIARRYCLFQNRKHPIIYPKVIPKQKNNIIKTKDGIVVSRPKGYNYIDKNYILNDKIKLPVIPRNKSGPVLNDEIKLPDIQNKMLDMGEPVIIKDSDSDDGTRLPCGCFNYYDDETNAEFNSDCFYCAIKSFFWFIGELY